MRRPRLPAGTSSAFHAPAVRAAAGGPSSSRAPQSRQAMASGRTGRSTDALDLAPGARIADRYVVERALAKGSMGAVRVTLDERMHARVAHVAWFGRALGTWP